MRNGLLAVGSGARFDPTTRLASWTDPNPLQALVEVGFAAPGPTTAPRQPRVSVTRISMGKALASTAASLSHVLHFQLHTAATQDSMAATTADLTSRELVTSSFPGSLSPPSVVRCQRRPPTSGRLACSEPGCGQAPVCRQL